MALAFGSMTTLDRSAVDALLARARRDVDDGLLPACQVALALDGEVLVHEAFGEADVDTRFTIFSATKPFIASLVWQLLGEGALTPDQPVADVIPEFGSNGKDAITLDHVLQHTAGLPARSDGPAAMGHPRGTARGVRRVASQLAGRFAGRVPPHLRPLGARGDRARHHRARTTPTPCAPACSSRSASPASCSDRRPTSRPASPTSCWWASPPRPDELEAALGIREIPVGEVTDEALMNLNTPAARAVGLPGGGGISNAADVALFYQALLHDPKGLWDPEVLARRHERGAQHVPGPDARVTRRTAPAA